MEGGMHDCLTGQTGFSTRAAPRVAADMEMRMNKEIRIHAGNNSAMVKIAGGQPELVVTMTDIVLDDTSVEGKVVISFCGPGGSMHDVPSTIKRDNPSFLCLVREACERTVGEIAREGGAALDSLRNAVQESGRGTVPAQSQGGNGTKPRASENASVTNPTKAETLVNGVFGRDGRWRNTSGARTVKNMRLVLDYYRDKGIPGSLKRGDIDRAKADIQFENVEKMRTLLDRHEDRIEHVETGEDGFGREHYQDVQFQLEAIEFADRHDIDVPMAKLVSLYIIGRKKTRDYVDRAVKEGMLARSEANEIMGKVREVAKREVPNYVSTRLNEIGESI